MNNCPMCHAEFPAAASYCDHCGYYRSQVEPEPVSPAMGDQEPLRKEPEALWAMPDRPSDAHSAFPAPTRTVRPAVKRTTQLQAVTNPRPDFPGSTGGPGSVDPPWSTMQGDPAGAQAQASPSNVPTQAGPGLIRPVGRVKQAYDTPQTPDAVTPARLAALPPKAPKAPPQAGQIIKPAFLLPTTPTSERATRKGPVPPALQQHSESAKVQAQTPSWQRLPGEAAATGRLPAPAEGRGQMNVAAPQTGDGVERLIATSRVADRWRSSWRERQHAEAGPATSVSRGQAPVPEPLISMQNSFVRMRAIIFPVRRGKTSRSANFGFWVAIFTMICLIGGLVIFTVSTYLPDARSGANRVASTGDTQPTLILQEPQAATIGQGQTLHVRGEHFGANDAISFLLDATIPITTGNGKKLIVQTSSEGLFQAEFPVETNWMPGEHLLQAQDSHTNQVAYLTIQVGLRSAPSTDRAELAFSLQNQPVQKLTFHAVVGQENPGQQLVTLSNTSSAALQWTASASADGNSSWLVIDSAAGRLAAGEAGSITVSVITEGLQSSVKPYTGNIAFTINGREQLTLPVELYVQDAQVEMVFSPNPVIIAPGPGSTCQPNTSVTLINLGEAGINWDIRQLASEQAHIQLNGQPGAHGQLAPSGQPEDMTVLALTCINVHAGDTYHLIVSYNGISRDVFVYIRQSS